MVQEIRDVAVVKVPERLRAYVEPKIRDVAMVTSGGILMSAIKLGIEALTYLAPLKAFRKPPPERRELRKRRISKKRDFKKVVISSLPKGML